MCFQRKIWKRSAGKGIQNVGKDMGMIREVRERREGEAEPQIGPWSASRPSSAKAPCQVKARPRRSPRACPALRGG